MIALLWLGLALASDDLESAYLSYPEDYAVAVAAAQARYGAGDYPGALEAWRRAEALSHGNRRSRLGQASALVALGRHAEATALSDTLIAEQPQRADAWMARAWSRRWRSSLPDLRLRQAAHDYRQATLREPNNADAWCGLASVQRSLGVSDLPSDCVTPARWQLSGTSLGALSSYGGVGGTGIYGVLQAGASYGHSAWFDLTGRTLSVSSGTRQRELWLRSGSQQAGSGGQLLLGGVRTNTDADTLGGTLIGGSAWLSYGLSLRLDAAYGRWTGGDSVQLGLSSVLPVTQTLIISGGLQRTSYSGSHGLSGWGALTARAHSGASLTAGLRSGQELMPVRFDDPSVYNRLEALEGSVFLRGELPIRSGLALSLGYGADRLSATLSTPEQTSSQLVSLGLHLTTKEDR